MNATPDAIEALVSEHFGGDFDVSTRDDLVTITCREGADVAAVTQHFRTADALDVLDVNETRDDVTRVVVTAEGQDDD